MTTTAVLAQWLDHIALKRQEGVEWDAIAEGLTLAGVRSATTGATLTGATVSAFYSRLRRRSDGEESLPALRARLAALEATLAQEQAETVQALAARDQAVSAQRAAEDDAAWWKLRWKAACDEAAAAKASRAETLGERDKARAEGAQEAQERAKAVAGRDQARKAQKVLTERLTGLKGQLATAEGDRDLARAEFAQAIQDRDQARTDRTASLEAQTTLMERLATLESRLAIVMGERDRARTEAAQANAAGYDQATAVVSLSILLEVVEALRIKGLTDEQGKALAAIADYQRNGYQPDDAARPFSCWLASAILAPSATSAPQALRS